MQIVCLLALFVVAEFPAMTCSVSCRWWFEKCCFPCCDLQVLVNVYDERVIGCWKGAEFIRWCPTLPCFERHVLPLHSVMDVHGSSILPYAAHMNLVARACTDFISVFTSLTLERTISLLGSFDNSWLAYVMQWSYNICSGDPMNCQKIVCSVEPMSTPARSFTSDVMLIGVEFPPLHLMW